MERISHHMKNTFLAMLFRMKYINRWSLMFNTRTESLSVHTAECALTTHFLCSIGNTYFNKNYDIHKLTTYALYHDATEILTGDLPTPIKYYNSDIKLAYKNIEAMASTKLLSALPDELKEVYQKYFVQSTLTNEELSIIKAADKVCAYIKCLTEINSGNKEFTKAYHTLKETVYNYPCEELKYFLDNHIEAFSMSLDELKMEL